MTANPSIFRRAYDAVALFALLNMVALAALAVILVGGGGVDAEKARRIVAVLRGDDVALMATATASPEPAAQPTEPKPVRDVVAESQLDQEILRREGERIKAELDQRLALNNSILLRVIEKRESFQHEQQEAVRQRDALTQQRHAEGFKKQIAILESLAPRTAVEHLLALPEADEAARILMEMETRTAKKIVEAAKDGDQLKRMKSILQRVRDVAPDRLEEIETSEP